MITPDKCLICGAGWRGGSELPGKRLMPDRRVYYECGLSFSYRTVGPGIYLILLKNCEKGGGT